MLRMPHRSNGARKLSLDWFRDKIDALGPQGDYIFAGALALLIVLALGYSVHATFFSDPTGSIELPEDDRTHFICRECGHEIALEPQEMRDRRRRLESEEDLIRLDCPECNTKHSMLEATWCPACKKYFLSERTKAIADMRPGEDPGDLPDDVCSHCNTNLREYRQERAGD